MVLNKWAVVNKSAPPAPGLRPLARSMLHHAKLKPAGYKVPFVLRPFIADRHRSELQHIENRGMYREELSIERSHFPRLHKTFVVQTDGSLNQREMEFTVPPVVLLFQDRLTAYRQRQVALAKIGQLRRPHSWEVPQSTSSTAREEDSSADHLDAELDEEPSTPQIYCNALEFPYCVPRRMRVRRPVADPLSSKSMKDQHSKK